MENNKLGRCIQLLRESNMMTREDFAQRIGVLRKTVVDWEEGNALPTAEQVLTIANFCGVDPRSMVEDPVQVAETAPQPERSAPVSGKKLTVGIVVLVLGIFILIGGVSLMQGLSASMDQPAVPAASSEVEIPVPLPESLVLAEVELAQWDLDGDGQAELVNPEGVDILLVQDGKAYALAEPLPKGQSLTAQDGVFIVKNEEGESRIYSRLRDGAIYPAG